MAVLILLTMFSRNYIGVHTPQDVVVGALLGVLVVLGGAFLWPLLERHPERDWLVPAVGALLTAAFLIYIHLKPYPLDYDAAGALLVDPKKMMKDGFKDAGRFLGVAVAWFLEKKFVDFSTEVPASAKVSRCVFGVLILLLYEQILMPSVTGAIEDVTANSWVSFLFTFFELFLLVFLYPLLFKTLEKRLGKKVDAAQGEETDEAPVQPDEAESTIEPDKENRI